MKLIQKILQKLPITVGNLTEVDEILCFALVLQRLFGQQVLDPQWTWRRFRYQHLFSIFLFIYVFLGTMETLKTTTDIELITEAYYTMIMIIIFPIKFTIFACNRFVFRRLYIEMKGTLLETIKETSRLEIVLKTVKKIVYILFAMVVIPVSNYELATLWNYLRGERTLLSRSTATLMPMTTPYYEVAWFLHTIFLCQISSTIILDMWFVLLIYFLCESSDSTIACLKIVKGESETILSYRERLNRSLRKFYEHHVKQDEYLRMLNSMYKWLALVPLFNAAMCICIILLLMSKEVNWRFAPHVLPMFAEIFAYNYFGEQIKSKANSYNQALLQFDWVNLNLEDRKNYYILVTYMKKKQFGIKTANQSELCLITMSAVLKASYQAFTILQSVSD